LHDGCKVELVAGAAETPKTHALEAMVNLVDDCEGLGADLDAAMQASVDATYDPWKEATAPKTPNQFTSIISAAEV
jgi:hypothetical protein